MIAFAGGSHIDDRFRDQLGYRVVVVGLAKLDQRSVKCCRHCLDFVGAKGAKKFKNNNIARMNVCSACSLLIYGRAAGGAAIWVVLGRHIYDLPRA